MLRLSPVLLTGALLALFSAHTAFAKAQAAASEVVAVTVYSEGALISRSARLTLDRGDNTITFPDLPAGLDAARVQIEVQDPAVQIGQVQLAAVQRSDAADAQLRALRNELEAAKQALTAITDSDKSADLTLKFLDGLAAGYAKEAWFEGARGSADAASWKAAITVLSDGSSQALAQKRANVSARAEATAEVSRIERELRNARGSQRANALLTVALRAPDQRTVQALLHYYTSNAGWQPLYEARLNSESGALELAQRASVYQRTSEDWQNIALTLATSEPEGQLTRPELDSEFIDLAPKAERGAKLANRMGQFSGVVADSASVEEVVVTAARAAPTTVSNFAVNYSVPGQVTVANDRDDDQLFDLSRDTFNARLVTQIVPRQSTSAYLAARFTYDKAVPLYSSDMRIYVDGVYAGASQMPTALPEAEITLPMGQDRRIEVSANDQGGKRGQQGIIGKRKTEVTDYLFTITNRRSQPTVVEVYDRYPVSRNKSVDVDITRGATKPTESDLEAQPGLVLWRKTLDGGDEWQIRHAYEISYPATDTLLRRR